MFNKFVSLGLALLGIVNGVESQRAHLIVEKNFANPPVVIGKDVNVTLTITNLGDTPATDIALSDKVRQPAFTVAAGEPVAKFESIASGATVSHSYTMHASKKGFHRMERAVINYKYTDEAGEEQSAKGASSTIFVKREDGGAPFMDSASLESGVFRVFTQEEEGENSSSATNEWILFWFGAALSVGGPYLLWNEEKKERFRRASAEKASR